jgi:hypothetical protein
MSLALFSARRRVIAAPPSGDPLTRNLPPGMIVTADTDFVTPRTNNNVINGWALDNGNVSFTLGGQPTPAYQRIEDASSRYGGVIGRLNYPDGHNGNGGSWQMIHYGFPATSVRECYFACRMRFSSGYVVHTNAYTEKFWYPTFTSMNAQSPVVQWAAAGAGATPPFRLGHYSYLENGNVQVWQPANVAAFDFFRETWYDIEIHQRIGTFNAALAPTFANADGFTRTYVNGTLVHEIQNWRGAWMTAQAFFQWPRLASTRGGGTSSVLAPFGGMWREFDRVLVAYRPE